MFPDYSSFIILWTIYYIIVSDSYELVIKLKIKFNSFFKYQLNCKIEKEKYSEQTF